MEDTATAKSRFQPDAAAHITYEDQQKINRFAYLNAKLEELKDEVKVQENDLKRFEEERDKTALVNPNIKISYLIDGVLIFHDRESTLACLDVAKQNIMHEIADLQKKISDIKEGMSDLKSHLYGKFGSHINLETDED